MPTKSPAADRGAAPEERTAPSGSGHSVWRYVLFLLIAAGGCAADLVSKELVFRWRGLPGQRAIVWLIDGYVGIETSLNRGALFGMGEGGSQYFALFSVLALAGVLFWLIVLRAADDRLLTISLGSISGGILGNLYDRLGLWCTQPLPPALQDKGFEIAVRDWILFCWNHKQKWGDLELTWPNFNIADSLLVCGALLLLWQAFFSREPKPAKS